MNICVQLMLRACTLHHEFRVLLESSGFLLLEIMLQFLALPARRRHFLLELRAPRSQVLVRFPQVVSAPAKSE